MTEKDFAKIIIKKRNDLKLSQAQAAKICEVSERTFQNAEYAINESNKSSISFSTYKAIAKGLGLQFKLEESEG
jgi:transcriptional regulator with XRE-family HTH domain